MLLPEAGRFKKIKAEPYIYLPEAVNVRIDA